MEEETLAARCKKALSYIKVTRDGHGVFTCDIEFKPSMSTLFREFLTFGNVGVANDELFDILSYLADPELCSCDNFTWNRDALCARYGLWVAFEDKDIEDVSAGVEYTRLFWLVRKVIDGLSGDDDGS